MKKGLAMVLVAAAANVALAQARDAFLLQQTQQEMQRVGGQVDMLQSGVDDLQRRMRKLEGGGAEADIRAEIQALKAAVAELRRELAAQRGEIVRDLSGRLSKMQQAQQPPPQPKTVTKTVVGPHREYVVQSGDTLSFVASTFGVSVARIRELNNLKGDRLRAGQKLILPMK